MVQESMRTAPGHQVKELVLKINLSLLNLTGKTCNRGYISVMSTRVRLVQKKSSRQATLG